MLLEWTVLLSLTVDFSSSTIDGPGSFVWGPAIDLPELDLPVRYFFVQLVGTDGTNLTHSPGKYSVHVDWQSSGCRFRRQLIDRQDGSFVVRFRLHNVCASIQISLTTDDGHLIGKSPYDISKKSGRWLMSENCNCYDIPSLDRWLQMADCTQNATQLDRDVARWMAHSVDFDHVIDILNKHWFNPDRRYSTSICHYRFVDNKIYRKCYGEYVGFKMFADRIFTSMARKMRLPNTEFLMNLGDWPLENQIDRYPYPIPIISWCGSNATTDIILPTYELTESTVFMLDRQSLDVQTILANENSHRQWNDKLDKAVFRGRDSCRERLELVLLARQHPSLLDAGITRFFFFNDEKERYEPTVEHLPFSSFFQYRYVLNIDGTVAAYRLPFLLAGDSLVLKQNSPFYEHFYGDLKPFEHFVPFKRNLDDVVERLIWARQHLTEVRKIVNKAKKFADDHLQPRDIYCYHALVIQRYTTLLKTIPYELDVEMEEVISDDNYYGRCRCKEAMKEDL